MRESAQVGFGPHHPFQPLRCWVLEEPFFWGGMCAPRGADRKQCEFQRAGLGGALPGFGPRRPRALLIRSIGAVPFILTLLSLSPDPAPAREPRAQAHQGRTAHGLFSAYGLSDLESLGTFDLLHMGKVFP